MRRPDPSLSRLVLVALVTALLVAPVTAYASHQFSDVPTTHVFHDSIDWMVDNQITAGCGADSFCPGSPVTRGQLSAFMKNLSDARVVDADRLRGFTPEALESKALEAQGSGPVLQTGAGMTKVVETSFRPAGGYFIVATVTGFRVGTDEPRVECELRFAGDRAYGFLGVGPSSGTITLTLSASTATGGTAVVNCSTNTESFQVQESHINMLSVNGVFPEE